MSELNLNALARQVLAESPSPDPSAMAATLVSLIPKNRYHDALLLMARDFMRHAIGDQRASVNGGPPNAGGSKKMQASAAAWKRLLNTPEFLPSAGWLFLKDATAEQVREMATVREAKAGELRMSASRYRAVAEAMRHSRAMRVADLPEDTLARLLGPEADAA